MHMCIGFPVYWVSNILGFQYMRFPLYLSIFSGWRAEGEISNAVWPKTSPWVNIYNVTDASTRCQQGDFQVLRPHLHAPSELHALLHEGHCRNEAVR